MRRKVFLVSVLTVFVLFLATSGVAGAQATRTWVSGVGDDANPCSRTAPCKTFAGAISKTAPGGEINVLDPGGFGAVTITKSITIDGSGGSLAGVLVSGTNGVVISAAASDVVVLRNLDIDGLNTGLAGIKFLAGGVLNVQRVTVYEFTGAGIDFEPNQAGVSQLFVSDSNVHNNAGGGILVKPAGGGIAQATILRVDAEDNSFGVRGEDRARVMVKDTNAVRNNSDGFVAVSRTVATTMFLEGCVSATNSTGVDSIGALSTIRISNNTLTNNSSGLAESGGGQIISFVNNRNGGNGASGAPTSTVPFQ